MNQSFPKRGKKSGTIMSEGFDDDIATESHRFVFSYPGDRSRFADSLHFGYLLRFMSHMKEANDRTSLSNFWTFVPMNCSFDFRKFLFCEVVISGFGMS